MDIHKIEKRLKNVMKKVEKLPERNKEILLKFRDECKVRGLSNVRVVFYLLKIEKIIRGCEKNVDEMNIDDVKTFVSSIESRTDYKEWTKSGYKLAIKKFFQFVSGFDWDSKDFPNICKWIHTSPRQAKLSDPTILSTEEILLLFKAAKGIREKALVSFMYESGCRSPDELFHMKIHDVEFDEYGAKVKLSSGKVGSRIIRIVSCVPHLKSWIYEQHPNNKPDSYVFVNIGTRNHGNVMSYSLLNLIVREWGKKAGITKKITPYTFRRTRYTHLSTKIPTPALYKYMGQVQGSAVIRRYVALNDEASDEAMLNFYGIKNSKINGDIKPLYCTVCNKQSPPEKEFCGQCNAPLTEKAKLKVDEKKTTEMDNMLEFMLKNKLEKELNVLIDAMIQKKVEELKK